MNIHDAIKNKSAPEIAAFCKEHNLKIENNKIVPIDEASAKRVKENITFWGSRQQARKILLNSLYGALLNPAMRLSDERMGQSVTLSGRSITKHMNSIINQILTGKYDYDGEAIQYSDTDSSYFSAIPVLGKDHGMSREEIIILYDKIAEDANSTFPEFMDKTFNTGIERGAIIKAGRELVASRGLFIKKKKYACLVYDDEGTRVDVDGSQGKLKVMGLDLKRADTPEYMQKFLKDILLDILTGGEEESILSQVADFRTEFKTKPAWEKGSPKKVSNLSSYGDKKRRSREIDVYTPVSSDTKKVMIPEHVNASLEWNRLLDHYGDKHSMRITDGSRIIVCKLKPNSMQARAVAYPVDEHHLPEWFKELPFNIDVMEKTIIDKKVSNLLEVLNWDLKNTHHNDADDLIQF